MKPSVHGVGINDGKYISTINGIMTKEYNTWKGMLHRCYYTKSHIKRPKYTDCTVSENFKNFSYFYEWCQNQIGFENKGWHLDKDILARDNKIYHEDLCVFVPSEINTLFLKCDSHRGFCPIGVTLSKSNKFIAQCNTKYYGHQYLGSFSNLEDAFYCYKEYKENIIQDIAHRFKEIIDPRVYQALITYSVSFHD